MKISLIISRLARQMLIISTIYVIFPASIFAVKYLKPRVLVIPFDNMMGDKNYEWMKSSISDNLKDKLTKTRRYDVMDVELLQKINPDIKFKDLTQEEATILSRKLNCEAAIIGRYITKPKDGKMNALIQVEAVNALSGESIIIKSEYADLDGTVFKKVEDLAQAVADEFVKKLPPIDPRKNSRSDHLEKLIARVENPPKGFFDTLSFDVKDLNEKQKKKIKLEPEFDIDTFQYDLYLPEGVKEVSYNYYIWGNRFTPYITADDRKCTQTNCQLHQDETEILISKSKLDNSSAEKNLDQVVYKIHIHRKSPPGPVLGRVWLNAGYPYMKSFSFISPNGNPAAMTAGGKFPFDLMTGIVSVEIGFAPGRWQLPFGINWSIAAQFQYAKGDVPLNTANSGLLATMEMFSMGGGFRLDRPFNIGNFYGISPMIGIYAQYQIFSNVASGSSFDLMGLNPEIGVIQYFRLGSGSKWKISLTTVFGSYLYQDQNLSYIRANAGVEYAFK